MLARSGNADLASYAAWALAEWAARCELSGQADLLHALVAPSLRSAAADSRVSVRANGVRGLLMIERKAPSPINAADLARLEQRKIRLFDLERVFDLWVEHYDRIDEKYKQLLPLRPVWFLAPPSE